MCVCVCVCVCVRVYTYTYLYISYCLIQRIYSTFSPSARALASSMCMQRETGRETQTHTYTHTHTHTGACAFTTLRIPIHKCDTPSFAHTLYIDMISKPRGLTCKCPCIRLCLELFKLRLVLPPTLPLSLTKSCHVHERPTIASLSLSFSLPLSLSHFLSRSRSLAVALSLSLFVYSQPRRHRWKLSTRAERASKRVMAATTAVTLGTCRHTRGNRFLVCSLIPLKAGSV